MNYFTDNCIFFTATERLKDKLTAAAREKVAMATKEKQLQLDRKRRAAAFLRTIHSESGSKGVVVFGPQLPGGEGVDREIEEGSDVASIPDAPDEAPNDKYDKTKLADHIKRKSTRHESEKRHRPSNSLVRHKHREKHRSKIDKLEKVTGEDSRIKELNGRISESSVSTEEDDKRRGFYGDKSRRSDDAQWKNKSDRDRSFRKEEKRHKRKKHKKDDVKDRSFRKHSKVKKQKRSRESDDSRNSRSKRCRKNSSSSSDEQNS